MFNSRKFNIQFFAEGEPEPAPSPAADPKVDGKTFSEDYVRTLREESAGYRSTAKKYEAALKKVFGITDTEELGDLDSRITIHKQSHKTALDNALKIANARLIKAELNNLEDYDVKLLSKVIDMSNVKVSDDGMVEGLIEAAEAAAKEYPAVVKTPPHYASGTGGTPVSSKYSPEINAFRKAAGLKEE